MSRHEQYTFTRGREVIEHGIGYLTRIRDALDELRGHDHGERVKMLLNSVAAEQRNLLGSVERLLEDASDKVLGTYIQYTVEMPTEVEPPDEPLTTLGLIQWLEGVNGPLHDLFAEVARNRDAEEETEAFAGLARQVQAFDMRLSKEYQRLEDL